MMIEEVKLTHYKTDDGRIFEKMQDAMVHDAIMRLNRLLLDENMCLTKHTTEDFFCFLCANRNEIIEIMGWDED
jgi:hypothetical protein